MFEVQENVSEAAKVESEDERQERDWRETQREWRERNELNRRNRREQTVGELLDALAQNNANPTDQDELADTLAQILDRARAHFANSEICCEALVIAQTAIHAAQHNGGRYIYPRTGAQLAKYLVLFANELQASRGAGCFDLNTRVLLEKITDLLPGEEDEDCGWDWPSSDQPLSYHHIKL